MCYKLSLLIGYFSFTASEDDIIYILADPLHLNKVKILSNVKL